MINSFNCYDADGNVNRDIKRKCLNIIHSKHRFDSDPKIMFHATVKLECPKEKINDFINFPIVFRNIKISNDESTIGSYMYNYGRDNKLHSVDERDTKLTMLLDTMGEFMTFGCYYLWFLIDHGLKVIDVENVTLYDCHRGFNNFVNEFMNERIAILSGEKHGAEKFYKICMNGSYGYDALNSENYNKIKIVDTDNVYRYTISDTYMSGTPLTDSSYLIQVQPKSFRCKTPLQEAFFTLDNAKFWYLTFIYDFLFKCVDLERIHFTSCDTDSVYFAVAGDMNRHGEQAFDAIISDRDFYDKFAGMFLPNPSIGTKADEKKILGCCIEKYGDNQVALCPKCYTIWNDHSDKAISLKLKGVSLKKNNIKSSDYESIIKDKIIVPGININLQMKKNRMSKVTVNKNALTGFHNKMIVLENESCVPFINGLTSNDIVIEVDDFVLDADEEAINELIDIMCMDYVVEPERDTSCYGLPLKVRFDDEWYETYNYSKHGTIKGHRVDSELKRYQTGKCLMVNQCPGLTVIDIDINKSLPPADRELIRNQLIEKLSSDDVIVKTGSGGLHIYTNEMDYDRFYKNSYVKCFTGENFDIDIFTSWTEDKQAVIMLPGSSNRNGEYVFIRGGYDSVLTRSSDDVMKDLGIDITFTKPPTTYQEMDDSEMVFLSDDEERWLVNGLTDMEIHNFASKIDERLTLLPLFSAINCLSPKNRSIAYEKVRRECRLTEKASSNFDSVMERNEGNHSHINVLKKIVRLYNPMYM